LDPALTRPGRFDRHVTVPLPDVLGRKSILDLYAQKVPMASDVDLSIVARGTSGCSGADLFNLINEAAIRASAKNQPNVTANDLEYARDKVLMGAERSNAGKSPEAIRLTAFHESGHALGEHSSPLVVKNIKLSVPVNVLK
jgi:ATP-dependent Zn protease